MKNIIEREIRSFKILLDEEDLPIFNDYPWYISSNGYVVARFKTGVITQTTYHLHRVILGVKDPRILLDHINGNKLDNRKENLRQCSYTQNLSNKPKYVNVTTSSKYKGVTWHKGGSKWIATITHNKKSIYLLLSENPLLCAYAYNIAAKLLVKEFAYINELDETLLNDRQKLYAKARVEEALQKIK